MKLSLMNHEHLVLLFIYVISQLHLCNKFTFFLLDLDFGYTKFGCLLLLFSKLLRSGNTTHQFWVGYYPSCLLVTVNRQEILPVPLQMPSFNWWCLLSDPLTPLVLIFQTTVIFFCHVSPHQTLTYIYIRFLLLDHHK